MPLRRRKSLRVIGAGTAIASPCYPHQPILSSLSFRSHIPRQRFALGNGVLCRRQQLLAPFEVVGCASASEDQKRASFWARSSRTACC